MRIFVVGDSIDGKRRKKRGGRGGTDSSESYYVSYARFTRMSGSGIHINQYTVMLRYLSVSLSLNFLRSLVQSPGVPVIFTMVAAPFAHNTNSKCIDQIYD